MNEAVAAPPVEPVAGSVPSGPPIAPPADPRPGSAGERWPRPASVPPTDGVPGTSAAPSPAGPEAAGPGRRRSVRSFLAFLAGAGVAAGSFGLGAALVDDTAAPPVSVNDSSPINDSSPESTPTPTPVPRVQVDDPVAAVAASLGPSVLQVETNLGQGSGVVYADGFVMTNHHVVDGASQVRVRSSDGRTFEADVVGSDERNDVAVLSIGSDSGLAVAPLARGQELVVGQLAVAIGSPFQLSQTVTAGIVSALNRPVANAAGGFNAMIQTDAPINPGNSGGALADGSGAVIGINTSIRTDGTGNGNLGIGFAVPIDTALAVAERITGGASLDPGVLGVTSSGLPDDSIGVAIGEVVDGGAADAAGLLSGDRILLIDGAPVTNFGEVVGLVQSKFPGDQIEITVIRGADNLTFDAVLG